MENNGLAAITVKPILKECFKEQICKKQISDTIINIARLKGIVLTESEINTNTIEKYIDYLDIPTGFIDLAIPNNIGSPVTITAVDVLVKNGLSSEEAKEFLSGLTLDQKRLISIASSDLMGDEFFKDAVLKTYERYYNDYLKEKDGKKDNDNTLTEVGSSSAGVASGLPPDDDDDKDKSKTSNKSESSSSNQQNRKDIENSWDKGTFDSPEGSLKYHFDKHGKEVGADNIEQYLRKATEFAKNLKGARKVKINDPTPGVIRYYKNGKYLDKLGNKIISFGKQ